MESVKFDISVVTPSLNQAKFLEATLQSVLSQGYSRLEHIVVDGASEDGSTMIIDAHSDHLADWVSEPDSGQANAINKGFAKATGDILCWINSDDLLAPGCLQRVADYFSNHPDAVWCTGQCQLINETGVPGQVLEVNAALPSISWLMHFRDNRAAILQPSTFWRREAWEAVGPLREDLHYAFDFEFFYRIREHFGPPGQLDTVLSQFRLHDSSKTVSTGEMFLIEVMDVVREKRSGLSANDRVIVEAWLAAERAKECFIRQQKALKQGNFLMHWRWRVLGWAHRIARVF
ncbi:glycosyltransferase family 2 protein [Thiocapsa roseopersicina]|uniref:Glycosyl transferase family 2 n=1 Tax=Thiocapsa roseopersicina TaxID=1058 RepID=A0A1H2QAS8_THIRO|nr:glycosyltransferase family 2 protein [Thiocapsa roseopersicina]SDW04185.1 Glycosyl transferase family 2 [Thiocapsa roseopersicina]